MQTELNYSQQRNSQRKAQKNARKKPYMGNIRCVCVESVYVCVECMCVCRVLSTKKFKQAARIVGLPVPRFQLLYEIKSERKRGKHTHTHTRHTINNTLTHTALQNGVVMMQQLRLDCIKWVALGAAASAAVAALESLQPSPGKGKQKF